MSAAQGRESGLAHRFGRSLSGRRHSSGRSSSNSPFRRGSTGLLTVLRQKLTAKVNRSRETAVETVSHGCRHSSTEISSSSATLSNSWRSRPRHIDKPIRPAYSDESLSCCGRRSNCSRGRTNNHGPHGSHELSVFDPEQTASRSKRQAASGMMTVCKYCHCKNDHSPSDFELSDREISQADDSKVHGVLPVDKEYGHAIAPNTSSISLTCDTLTVRSSACECAARKSAEAASPCAGAMSIQVDVSAVDVATAAAAALTLNVDSVQVVPPTQPFYDQVKETGPKGWSLSKELFRLSKYGWYWGPITRVEAEEKLAGQTDGAFLVRDSSDDHYLLSLSFRSYGRTLHTRIEHCNGIFSFYAQPESEGYSSIVDLIEHSMTDSQSGVFCYSRARMPGSPSFPVRLARPVSRFAQVRSLQYLCRFCIRQYTRVDHIQQLPLPTSIKGWLEEGQY